jgi:hypothetical protein
MYDIIFVSRGVGNTAAYDEFKLEHPNALRLTNTNTLTAACAAARLLCYTSMFWLVTDDVELVDAFDFEWKPEEWDRQYPHVWQNRYADGSVASPYEKNEFAGVFLIPTKHVPSAAEAETGWLDRVKVADHQPITLRQFDRFFVSWDDCAEKYQAFCDRYPGSKWIQNTADPVSACLLAAAQTSSEMYWLVMDTVNPHRAMDLTWRPNVWDRKYPHGWKTITDTGVQSAGATGIYLVPGDYQPSGDESQQGYFSSLKVMDELPSSTVPCDIFFISYNEPDADTNFALLKDRFARAQRVHGIKGIHNAHKRCAELSSTAMFWTVDADTVADPNFNFDYHPPDYDRNYLHIWHSYNPVNGLSYGWGAIKLWPTDTVLRFNRNWLDFTTTVGNIKMVPDIAAITNYNVDARSSWRSGFREAVKLCSNIVNGDWSESLERLLIWMTTATTVPFAVDSMHGAISGFDFYLEHVSTKDQKRLKLINDFEWLDDRFNNRVDQQDRTINRSDIADLLRNTSNV